MAIRFYLSHDLTTLATGNHYKLLLDKAAGVIGITENLRFGSGTGVRGLCDRWYYTLPSNQAFSGSVDFAMACKSAFAPEQDPHWWMHIWVTEGDTTTLRGTLLDYSDPAGTTNRFTVDPYMVRGLTSPQTLTPVTGFAGDILRVEIGYLFYVAPGTAAIYFAQGCNPSFPDATVGETGLSSDPWIEFASVPFPPPPTDMSQSCPKPTIGDVPDPIGPTPPWVQMCDTGCAVDSVDDIAPGEVWL